MPEPDREAVDRLIRRHIHFVHAAALRQVRDPHLADDITQAVFILLLRKPRKFRDDAAMANWLFMTTRYASANARRMIQRRQHHEQQAAIAAPHQIEAEFEQVETSELLPLLDDAIAHLSSVDRACVVMNYLQGQPLAEVGKSLGVSEAAARKRVSRAVEKMRSYFAANGMTVGAVAITSAMSGPSIATLQLVQSTLNIATLSQHAGSSAGAIAKGVNTMIFAGKMKLAAAACLAVAFTTLVAAQVTERAKVPTPRPTTAPTVAADHDTVNLGEGESIQFVGIAPWPNGDDQWHTIDGTPIPKPTKLKVTQFPFSSGLPVYQLLIRLRYPADADFDYTFTSAHGGASGANNFDDHPKGEPIEFLVVFEPDDNDKPFDLYFDLADLPWKTIVKLDDRNQGEMRGMMVGSKIGVAFGPLIDSPGGALMYFAHNDALNNDFHDLCRMMYTDAAGKFREAQILGGGGGNGLMMEQYTFEVPPAQIDSIELQTRVFNKHVRANNVALHPQQKTKPQIVTTGVN